MKSVQGQTNLLLQGLKTTAKTRTFVDIGSVIDVFCESFSIHPGKPKPLYPRGIHCVIENHHAKRFSKYILYSTDFSPLHTLEPYIEKTNIVSLGFFTMSQFFAADTVILIQKEILEGVAHVAHFWQKSGGSISQTRWIYN
ncbi:unnamed protein product [Calypogeia fissa]